MDSRKEQMGRLMEKIATIDFVLERLNLNHKDYADVIEKQYKEASEHKLKLTEELLRVLKVESITVVKDIVVH